MLDMEQEKTCKMEFRYLHLDDEQKKTSLLLSKFKGYNKYFL